MPGTDPKFGAIQNMSRSEGEGGWSRCEKVTGGRRLRCCYVTHHVTTWTVFGIVKIYENAHLTTDGTICSCLQRFWLRDIALSRRLTICQLTPDIELTCYRSCAGELCYYVIILRCYSNMWLCDRGGKVVKNIEKVIFEWPFRIEQGRVRQVSLYAVCDDRRAVATFS